VHLVGRQQLSQGVDQLAAQLGRSVRLRRGAGDAVERGVGASRARA
jgi:hypothetical protein